MRQWEMRDAVRELGLHDIAFHHVDLCDTAVRDRSTQLNDVLGDAVALRDAELNEAGVTDNDLVLLEGTQRTFPMFQHFPVVPAANVLERHRVHCIAVLLPVLSLDRLGGTFFEETARVPLLDPRHCTRKLGCRLDRAPQSPIDKRDIILRRARALQLFIEKHRGLFGLLQTTVREFLLAITDAEMDIFRLTMADKDQMGHPMAAVWNAAAADAMGIVAVVPLLTHLRGSFPPQCPRKKHVLHWIRGRQEKQRR